MEQTAANRKPKPSRSKARFEWMENFLAKRIFGSRKVNIDWSSSIDLLIGLKELIALPLPLSQFNGWIIVLATQFTRFLLNRSTKLSPFIRLGQLQIVHRLHFTRIIDVRIGCFGPKILVKAIFVGSFVGSVRNLRASEKRFYSVNWYASEKQRSNRFSAGKSERTSKWTKWRGNIYAHSLSKSINNVQNIFTMIMIIIAP